MIHGSIIPYQIVAAVWLIQFICLFNQIIAILEPTEHWTIHGVFAKSRDRISEARVSHLDL